MNNSSFTDAQWKAINSGSTAELIAQILINKEAINALEQEKADRTDLSTKANNSTVTTLSNKVAKIEQGYVKDATVSNNKLSITKSDGSSLEFEGGGGSKVIVEVWK